MAPLGPAPLGPATLVGARKRPPAPGGVRGVSARASSARSRRPREVVFQRAGADGSPLRRGRAHRADVSLRARRRLYVGVFGASRYRRRVRSSFLRVGKREFLARLGRGAGRKRARDGARVRVAVAEARGPEARTPRAASGSAAERARAAAARTRTRTRTGVVVSGVATPCGRRCRARPARAAAGLDPAQTDAAQTDAHTTPGVFVFVLARHRRHHRRGGTRDSVGGRKRRGPRGGRSRVRAAARGLEVRRGGARRGGGPTVVWVFPFGCSHRVARLEESPRAGRRTVRGVGGDYDSVAALAPRRPAPGDARALREIRHVERVVGLGDEHRTSGTPGGGVGGFTSVLSDLRRVHGDEVGALEEGVRLHLRRAVLRPEPRLHLRPKKPRDEILRRRGETVGIGIVVGFVFVRRGTRPLVLFFIFRRRRRLLRGPRDGPREDVFKNFHGRLGVERRHPDQELEHDHPERPPVHLRPVRLAQKNLRREVIGRPLRRPRLSAFRDARRSAPLVMMRRGNGKRPLGGEPPGGGVAAVSAPGGGRRVRRVVPLAVVRHRRREERRRRRLAPRGAPDQGVGTGGERPQGSRERRQRRPPRVPGAEVVSRVIGGDNTARIVCALRGGASAASCSVLGALRPVGSRARRVSRDADVAQAEIRELDVSVGGDEEVIGLDVAVDDAPRVAVFQGERDLRGVLRAVRLAEPSELPQERVQVAADGELGDDVEVPRGGEGVVQLDDERVIRVDQRVALRHRLRDHVLVDEVLLANHLHRVHVPGGVLAAQIHLPVRPAADPLHHLEVLNGRRRRGRARAAVSLAAVVARVRGGPGDGMRAPRRRPPGPRRGPQGTRRTHRPLGPSPGTFPIPRSLGPRRRREGRVRGGRPAGRA